MNTLILLALIKALTQEVNLLELQLAQQQASSSVIVATTTPIFPPAYHQWTPPVSTPTTTQSQTLGAVEPTSSCSLTATVETVAAPNPQGLFDGANVELDWTGGNSGVLNSGEIKNGTYAPNYSYNVSGVSTTYSYQPIYELTTNGVNCYAYLPNDWGTNNFPLVGDVSTNIEPSEYQGIFIEK